MINPNLESKWWQKASQSSVVSSKCKHACKMVSWIVTKIGQAKHMAHAKPTAWTIGKWRMTNNVKVSIILAKAGQPKRSSNRVAIQAMSCSHMKLQMSPHLLATVLKFRAMIIHNALEHFPSVTPAPSCSLAKQRSPRARRS